MGKWLATPFPDPPEYVNEWCMYNGNTFSAPDRVQPEELLGMSTTLIYLFKNSIRLQLTY